MAEKNIALKIRLDGVEYIINSVQSLEAAITKLKGELDSIPKSSDAYSAMSGVITGLENQMDNFTQQVVDNGDAITTAADKGTEAMGQLDSQTQKTNQSLEQTNETVVKSETKFDKLFQNYVKIGSAVTSSFAAAQSVLATFGADTTEIAEAAAKAQSLLTVAIAAKQAAEAVEATTTVAATVATKLKTAADNTQIGVLKKLYTVLAANPYLLIAAAIGAVVTAFIAFTTQAKQTLNVQRELSKVTSDEASKLTVYGRILKDVNSSNRQRKEVVDELVKQYPGFNILIDKENRLNAAGAAFIELKAQALVKEAQAKLIVQKISENNVKINEIENRTVEESLTFYDKLLGKVALLFSSYGQLGESIMNSQNAMINNDKEIKKITAENEKWYNSLKGVFDEQGKIDSQLGPIEKMMQKYADTQKDVAKSTEETNKATEQQILLAKQLENALNDTKTSLEDTLEIFQQLAETEGFDPVEPEVLQKLKEFKDGIDSLRPEDLQKKFKNIGLDIAFKDGVFAINETESELYNLEDTFGIVVEGLRNKLTAGLLTLDFKTFTDLIGSSLDELSFQLQNNDITKEAFEAGRALVKQYETLGIVLKGVPDNIKEVFTPEILQEFLDINKEIGLATKDIRYDIVDGQLVKIEDTTIRLTEQEKRLQDFRVKTISELESLYKKNYNLREKLSQDDYNEQIDNLVKTGKLQEDQGKDLKERYVEYFQDYNGLIKQIATAQFDALQKTTEKVIEEEDAIRGFLADIQKTQGEAIKLIPEGVARTIVNNLDLVFEYTQKVNKIVIDETQTVEQKRNSIKEQFSKKNIDLETLTQEEIDQIINFYLEKQQKAQEEADKKRLDRIQNIQSNIEAFQSALNSLSQTTSLFFDSQFDQLEKRYTRLQDTIIGDTEEANQKRLEAEKSYQQQKAELEKKAAKTALRISLAQALANTAEAITKLAAITGGVGAVIGAGAIVAFNAAQVAIIGNQLATIDSYRKGGRIKMGMGGMVSGPAHEYGGVKFQGGGIELEGNESVINRYSTINYMGLLDQINQAGGGKPIQPIDDSRIVEAIAKQRNTPIRAYVVESDITAKQETARRLEKLSQY